MAVRVLIAAMALLTFYGCGQSSPAPAESEKEGGIARPEDTPSAASPAKDCSDFYGPQDAQAYLETKAAAADKENLNPDGDEWACNEGGVTFKSEPDITLANFGGLSDRESIGLLHCQFVEYAQDHGQDVANEYVEGKIDENLGGGQATTANAEITSVQEHFIEDGYSCTYDEIIATLNRRAASASLSSSAP